MCEYRKINWRRYAFSFLYMVDLNILVLLLFFFTFAFFGKVNESKLIMLNLYKEEALKAGLIEDLDIRNLIVPLGRPVVFIISMK